MNVVLTQVNILANTLDLRILQVVRLIQPFFLIKNHVIYNSISHFWITKFLRHENRKHVYKMEYHFHLTMTWLCK